VTEGDRIVDQLERSFRGEPWFGSSVTAVLAGVSAATAASYPIPGAHSIWELVLHMTGWKQEVLARLQGQSAGDPAQGDWPAQPENPSEAAWADAMAGMNAAHDALVHGVRQATAAQLAGTVRDERSGSAGAAVTQWQTLHGVVQHDVYHLGQISLLRRAAGA
jgi:uncharacterized damage-inducible protein DinB